MGHSHDHFLGPVFARAVDQSVHHGDQALGPLETETLGTRELGIQMFFEILRRRQALEHMEPVLVTELGFAPHAFHSLTQPLGLLEGGDVHELRTDVTAIGLFQRVDNLAQCRLLATDIEGAGLESGIQVRLGETVKLQLHIRRSLALPQPQRIQTRLLVTAIAVGGDQILDLDLFALVIDVHPAGTGRRRGPRPAPAEELEVILYGLMGCICYGPVLNPRQSLEESTPLFGHGVGIVQIDLVEILDISGIGSGIGRGPEKVLHDAVLHRLSVLLAAVWNYWLTLSFVVWSYRDS